MILGLKKFAIETLEIAEWNVLKAIFRLKPQDFEIQIRHYYNPINWIVGHLAIQMDYIFNYSHSIRDGGLRIDVLKETDQTPFDLHSWIEETAKEIEELRKKDYRR